MTVSTATSTATTALSHVARNKWVQAVLVAVVMFGVYFLAGNASSPFVQYVQLADSLLHGRLYLTPEQAPAHLELARYFDNGAVCDGPEPDCRGYVIDPPAPALLLVPFVALLGPGVNQALVSLGYGAVAMGLFWVATRQLGWDRRLSVAMTILAGVGTNFWANATDGSLWQFSHVGAVLFMMAALVEATGKKRPWLVGLLVGLAGLSRLPSFLGFPFFLYLMLRADTGSERIQLLHPATIRKILGFGTGLGAMAALYFAHNYARFNSIFDRGYSYPEYVDTPGFIEGRRFDIAYIPRHLEAIFTLAPKLTEQFPFFQPTITGMALIMVTPAFLFAFAAAGKRIEVAAAVSLVLVATVHFLHASIGWTQFGYRFSLDYLPMLLVLTASGMGYQMGTRKWLIVGVSVFMAMWGPLYFFDTRLEDLIGYQWKLS